MNIYESLNCQSCSKESYKTLPIARVIVKLNELFATNDLPAVGRLLIYWENEARILQDDRGLLEILNEEIGYYRRTAEKEKALSAVNEAFGLIEKQNAIDVVSSATVYLNGATTMKAFGQTMEAMAFYEKAKDIYERNLEADDYRLAAFYNNVSSAYKDIGALSKCEASCKKALSILEGKRQYHGEIAVTYLNLAHLYYDQDPLDERTYVCVENAYAFLKAEENIHDGSFAFFCEKCYPSFGYFGYLEYEKEIKAISEAIYEGN